MKPDAKQPWRGLLIPAVLAFFLLIGLGTWQIQRKAWKEGLIADLHRELAAAPIALPGPAALPTLEPKSLDFHIVKFSAEFEN